MHAAKLIVPVLALLAACSDPASQSQAQQPPMPQPTRAPPVSAAAMKTSFAPVVKRAAPAVVNVSSKRVVRQRVDPFWDMFIGGGVPRERIAQSLGSGAIVREDGVILTNNHTIEGADEVIVQLADKREFPAKVLLADPKSDLAVLKIDVGSEKLPVIAIDDQEALEVGDLVLAIGNPFGVGQTVTNGIISALNRTETGISDSGSFIQTDAAINPGNSGGALVDMDGDLIGINTAIFSRSGSSSGVGFAVPASMVKRVVDSAVGGATAVVRPWLGVKGDAVSADIARSLDMDRPQGLVVTQVWPNGPGDRAGLREGDVITAIDGAEVNDQGGLNFRVGTRAPNETVEVTVLRDGRTQTLNARVQRLPGDASTENATVVRSGVLSGAQVLALNPALADSLGGDPFASGVIVGRVQRGSYANRVGVQGGDIILSVNGRAVSSVQQLADVGRGSELTINRRGQRISGVIR